MNFGLRKMQISRAVVPPKTMRPIQACSGAATPAGAAALPPAPASRRSASQTSSRPTPREPLTSTVSPGREELREQPCGRGRVGQAARRAAVAGGDLVRQRADRDEQLDARVAGVLAELAVQIRSLRAQLEHVAEHRHEA